MRSDITPFSNIIERSEIASRGIVRQAYLDVINYLCSLSSDFEGSPDRIAELDDGTHDSWPIDLRPDYRGNLQYIDRLLTYRKVLVGMVIGQTMIGFKFPTLTMKIKKIGSYTKRRWIRAINAGQDYYGKEPLLEFEKTAFTANRLPTTAEVLNSSGLMYDHAKHENHAFSIYVNNVLDVLKEFESRYEFYNKSLKRITSSLATSTDSVYKTYIKYRGKPELTRWQASHTTKIDADAKIASAVTKAGITSTNTTIEIP